MPSGRVDVPVRRASAEIAPFAASSGETTVMMSAFRSRRLAVRSRLLPALPLTVRTAFCRPSRRLSTAMPSAALIRAGQQPQRLLLPVRLHRGQSPRLVAARPVSPLRSTWRVPSQRGSVATSLTASASIGPGPHRCEAPSLPAERPSSGRSPSPTGCVAGSHSRIQGGAGHRAGPASATFRQVHREVRLGRRWHPELRQRCPRGPAKQRPRSANYVIAKVSRPSGAV